MTASSDRLLRRTMWGNAAFSAISGAILVGFASPFAAIAAYEPVSVVGLGLAIVKQFADVHGARTLVGASGTGGAMVGLEFGSADGWSAVQTR